MVISNDRPDPKIARLLVDLRASVIDVPEEKAIVFTEYLDTLREALPPALDRFRPDLVVYNAGSDVLWSDPLSHLFLTTPEVR